MLRPTNQPNEQLPDYSSSSDFVLDLLDFLKSGDWRYTDKYISLTKNCIVSVLGRDEGYTVKYNPLPEGVFFLS